LSKSAATLEPKLNEIIKIVKLDPAANAKLRSELKTSERASSGCQTIGKRPPVMLPPQTGMSAPADLLSDPSPDASAGAAKDADYSAALKELSARPERFKTESSGRLKVADREFPDHLTVSERQFKTESTSRRWLDSQRSSERQCGGDSGS
jgi:hypothetical protein